MDEKRIWAPWRLGYVAGKEEAKTPPLEPSEWSPGADEGCFVCRAGASYQQQREAARQNLVVATGEHTVTLLNRYPYSNGHLLVCPHRHVGQLHELTPEEHLEAMQTLGHFTQLLAN